MRSAVLAAAGKYEGPGISATSERVRRIASGGNR